jgi:hypothetical protein
MCSVDDCPPPQVYDEAHRVARKVHLCTECWRDIKVGEKYVHIRGLWEDAWSTHRLCWHCGALSAFMVRLCGGWVFGSLYTELVDHWREGYASIPLGRLIVAMRLKWHGGVDPVPSGCGEMARELMAGAVA